MTSNLLKTAAALASAGMLTGCITGAYGSSSLISGVAGAVAMDMIMGGLDDGGVGAGGGGDLELNPAARNTPDLGDARLTAWQTRLMAEQRAFAAIADQQLSMDGALDCALGADAAWLIAAGVDSAAADRFAGLPTDDAPHIALVEGECRNGAPEGPFTAIVRYDTGVGLRRQRVTGAMTNGRLEGEWRTHGVTEMMGHELTSSQIAHYSGGELVGRILSIGAPSTLSATLSTSLIDYPGPDLVRTKTWTGDMLSSEGVMNFHTGQNHGWYASYPYALFRGQRPASASPQYICYQNGQPAAEALCGPRPAPGV